MINSNKVNKYEVFEGGIYVGILELTLDQVKKFTAQAVYVLKAVR